MRAVWPYIKGCRPDRSFEPFHVFLYEIHILNFGSPPLYHHMQQHRDAQIGGGAATTLAALCGSLYVKGSRPGEFRMVGLTSALSVSCGLM